MNFRNSTDSIANRVISTFKQEVVDFLILCNDHELLEDDWVDQALDDRSWQGLTLALQHVTVKNWEDEHYIAKLIQYGNNIC